MTITITNAQIYSMNKGKEVAYEVEYSEGTKVRAVEAGNTIRKEYKDGDTWKLSGKPYIVDKNKKRQAEKLKEVVKAWVN